MGDINLAKQTEQLTFITVSALQEGVVGSQLEAIKGEN